MDTRLLKHYEAELSYLRDMGAEFAQAYPKMASRLGMDGLDTIDPYVERLLEGAAFLAARVQLELSMQVPEITSHLLEIVYPHYLAPTPSMMVASFVPDLTSAGLKEGYGLPRGSVLRSRLSENQQTFCEFRTAHDIVMWPIEIVEAEYIDGRGALVAAGIGRETPGQAGIRLRLRRSDGGRLSELALDRISLFIDPRGGMAWQLHELLCSRAQGLMARGTDPRKAWTQALPEGRIIARGFDRSEALLPTPRRSLDGYRLLQEYFAMPERFLFVDIEGVRPGLRKAEGGMIDLYILLREGNAAVAAGVSPGAFVLNAVPAVNLFVKRCDRVRVRAQDIEHHVVPDRTAALDFEIHGLHSVSGIRGDGGDDILFSPFYSATDLTSAGCGAGAYYTIRRRLRQRSEREQLRGSRTSYLGSELYLTLVDRKQAPFDAKVDQLAVTALCSNRDLPILLYASDDIVFHASGSGPVRSVRTPVSPTRPRPPIAEGDRAWKLISHLSLNYLSIADTDAGGGAEALRELVSLYAPPGDHVAEKQIEGIVSVSSRPIVRRMADEVLSTAVRGLEISLELDESGFEGASAYALGAVLERFFRNYVSINSFAETVLTTDRRGEIARWAPAIGTGKII